MPEESNIRPEGGFPPATPQPCRDCPWRREGHRAGWLGPHDADWWIEVAHGEHPIACHLTIKDTNEEGHGNWAHPAMRQCRGMASFRANVCKDPRDPSIVAEPQSDEVFGSNEEFLAYHTDKKFVCLVCRVQVVYVPRCNGRQEYWRHLKQPETQPHRIWPMEEGDRRLEYANAGE